MLYPSLEELDLTGNQLGSRQPTLGVKDSMLQNMKILSGFLVGATTTVGKLTYYMCI